MDESATVRRRVWWISDPELGMHLNEFALPVQTGFIRDRASEDDTISEDKSRSSAKLGK